MEKGSAARRTEPQTSSTVAMPASPESIASVPRTPVVPAAIRSLLGPTWIIEGEDLDVYEQLLASVGAAVEPLDIIDWLLVNDVVVLTWLIQRSRRHCEGIMRTARREAMESLLSSILPPNKFLDSDDTEAAEIARDWFNGDKKATKRAEELLAQAGFSLADVAAQSLSAKAEELDRLDQQTERREHRRDSILQQIERRRAGWSKLVKRASEDIVDAKFEELPPRATADQAEGYDSSQK
jgi:hypothetical protein